MVAVRSRLRSLLEEWPEHPILTQLAAICDRLLRLPAAGPLKAALTGVELLLGRSQTWEDGAAKAVSLAPQLAACAAVAQRWRAAELAAWPRALEAASRRAATRAHATWFPLFRLLTAAPGGDEAAAWLRGVAAALEEYLRAAPLGEFERRLDLLWSFHAALGAPAALSGCDGSVQLSRLLFNTHRYYSQFSAAVRAALAAAGAPIEAKLKDHVRLAKWEVRLSRRARLVRVCRTSFSVRPWPSLPAGLSLEQCVQQRGSFGWAWRLLVLLRPILSQHLNQTL